MNHGNLFLSKLLKIRFVSAYACWRLPRVFCALLILFEQQPETWKTRGRRENSFWMKKRLPNLSSAIILPLLSYLAQSPTGRCQSGRMSTPGKCVYRKPVPRVRIPPCPPSIFHHNILLTNILWFLFGRVWGRDGDSWKKKLDGILRMCFCETVISYRNYVG